MGIKIPLRGNSIREDGCQDIAAPTPLYKTVRMIQCSASAVDADIVLMMHPWVTLRQVGTEVVMLTFPADQCDGGWPHRDPIVALRHLRVFLRPWNYFGEVELVGGSLLANHVVEVSAM